MSKTEELWNKYKENVSNNIFIKFDSADKTPTKKYLPYLVKTWAEKNKTGNKITSLLLIDLVRQFEIYINYIEVKDIYNPIYSDVNTLRSVIDAAVIKFEEKTFNRDEHIRVILETDNFLLLQPITHKGSLKYGANTKWCTASKNSESTFTRYSKQGFLAYLISKSEKPQGNLRKVAFYTDETSNPMGCEVAIYNAVDTTVTDSTLTNNGWEWEDVIKVLSIYRFEASKAFRQKRAKTDVNKTLTNLKSIDLEELQKNIMIAAGGTINNELLENAQETLSKLIGKLNLELNK